MSRGDRLRNRLRRASSGLGVLVLNDWLLLFLAGGFFLSLYVFWIDTYGPLLSLLTLVVVLRLAIRRSIGIRLPRLLLAAFLSLAAIVAVSHVSGDFGATTKALTRIGYAAVLTLAAVMLYRSGLLLRFAPWFLGLGVSVHYLAWRLFDMRYGMTTNRHFLAAFAVLTAPAFVYWIRYPYSGLPLADGNRGRVSGSFPQTWQRVVLTLLLLMDLDLLVHTESTAAYLGTLVALALAFALYATAREQVMAAILAAVAALVFWVTDYGGIATEIGAQIENITREERVQIWTDSWSMFQGNTLTSWLVGNGVGQFRAAFPHISDPEHAHLIFPHNFALEITYGMGLSGLAVATLLFGWPLWQLERGVRRENESRRFAGIIILVTFLAWFIMAYLVFPFFSKSTLYSFGILLGVTLAYLSESEPAARY